MSDLFRSALSYIGGATAGQNGQESDFIGQIIELGPLRLTIRRLIAEGGFAYIFLANDQKGIEYALKRLLAGDKEANEAIAREIHFLKQLSGHPNVICCIQAASLGKDQYNLGRGEYLILTEYCKNGPLVEVLRCLTEPLTCEQVTKIFFQTCRAVLHMHSQKPPIIHCDLKIENLLFDSNWTIKLCDFGSATCETYSPDDSWSAQQRRSVEEQLASRTTPMYRAPEMLDLYQNFEINEKLDIWALGCILYFLCYLQHPFEDSAKLKIINAKYSLPSNNSRYSVFHDLIYGMFRPDPKNRPNIREICERLEEIAAAMNINLNESLHFSQKTLANIHAKSPNMASNAHQPAKEADQSSSASQSAKILGSLKGQAGSLFKNIKDTSAKMVQNVQTNKLYGIGPLFAASSAQLDSAPSTKSQPKCTDAKPLPRDPSPGHRGACRPAPPHPPPTHGPVVPERTSSLYADGQSNRRGSADKSHDGPALPWTTATVVEADLLGLNVGSTPRPVTSHDFNHRGSDVCVAKSSPPLSRDAVLLDALKYADGSRKPDDPPLGESYVLAGILRRPSADVDLLGLGGESTPQPVGVDAPVVPGWTDKPSDGKSAIDDCLLLNFVSGSIAPPTKKCADEASDDLLCDWSDQMRDAKSENHADKRTNDGEVEKNGEIHKNLDFLVPPIQQTPGMHRNISAPSLVNQMQAKSFSGSSNIAGGSLFGDPFDDLAQFHLSGGSGRTSPASHGDATVGSGGGSAGASAPSGVFSKHYPGSFSNFAQTSGTQSPQRRPGAAPCGQSASAVFGRPNYNRSNFDTGGRSNGGKAKLDQNAFDDLLSAQSFPVSGGPRVPQSMGAMKREVQNKELDPIVIKIRDWTEGKQRNVRALLCSLHTVLWESNEKWDECNMGQLLTPAQVKKFYRKACLAVHPDKLTGTEHAELARLIFTELNDAWNEFAKSEQLTAVV